MDGGQQTGTSEEEVSEEDSGTVGSSENGAGASLGVSIDISRLSRVPTRLGISINLSTLQRQPSTPAASLGILLLGWDHL